MEEYKSFWKNYIKFSGRASKREFWIPFLFNLIISLILNVISSDLGTIFALVYLIPYIAVAIRRLHDINKSGWFLLLGLIPFVGFIVLVVFWVLDPVNEGNNYGDVEVNDINE